MKKSALLLAIPLAAALLQAQSASDPLSAGNKGLYNMIKNNLVKAAEKKAILDQTDLQAQSF